MPRTSIQVFESSHQIMNTLQIFRESLGILLLHPTHFHSISIFLFSPLPFSLFISHFLIHKFPEIPFSALNITDHFLGQNIYPNPNIPKVLSNTIFHIIICFPSSITFSLLGKAATIQSVSDSYKGITLNPRRVLLRSGLSWIKLLHTSFWEFVIVITLFGAMLACLATIPKILFSFGICSRVVGFWGVLGFLGVPFCVAFAHVMVLGNLARVLAVLEGECYGLESFVKGRSFMEGRRQTALGIALWSNVGLRLVECLFEFRMCKGMSMWECPLLVSMYSLVLVLDSVMNVVFYYSCKSWGSSTF